MSRREGTTTRQMEAAPKGAVFVWCNSRTDYAVRLAQKIGRADLKIETPAWLERRWRGLEFTGVVIDHAARLTDELWDGYMGALARVRQTQNSALPVTEQTSQNHGAV